MLWLLIGITVVVVVVIALVAVGQVTLTLAEQPRGSVYDLDEAVDFVADELPDDVTAVVSFDDVRAVLGWHLDYLETKGVAFEAGEEPESEPEPQPEGVDVEPVDPDRGPIVADDDEEALAYVLGKVSESERDIADDQVVEILDAGRRYLEAIGAVGTAVPSPEEPA